MLARQCTLNRPNLSWTPQQQLRRPSSCSSASVGQSVFVSRLVVFCRINKKEEGPKRLILLRHAKSEWDVPEGTLDRDRPLAPRGCREADEIGRKLAKMPKWHPDFILVSDSLRTQQTLDRVFKQVPKLRKRAATYVVPLIYETSHGDMHSERNLATNLSGAITMFLEGTRVRGRNVMVVGHNDGFQALASLLSDQEVTLKTADAALLKSPAEKWIDAMPGPWKLKEVLTTREQVEEEEGNAAGAALVSAPLALAEDGAATPAAVVSTESPAPPPPPLPQLVPPALSEIKVEENGVGKGGKKKKEKEGGKKKEKVKAGKKGDKVSTAAAAAGGADLVVAATAAE